ncbi:hypothetical protein LPJ53_006266 [Coemansia erecta]|uniref:Uncharacterized protein n=1 Tax=Coemansia erecta TaxID=147472 RepID=A0A9W8CMW3_9FUNG|nr:hypothetical protein LPJ53_006266 [Coemansia erecta]
MVVNIDLVGFEGLEEYGAEQTSQHGHAHRRPNSHPSRPSDTSPHRITRRSSSGLSSSPTSSSSSSGGMNTPPSSGRSEFSSKAHTVRKRSNSGSTATAAAAASAAIDSGLPFADVLDNRMRFYQENYECAFCRAETKTFDGMKAHIALEHPWFDLSLHQNIR